MTFDLDKEYVAGTYARFPVEIVSGKGCIAVDANGKEYIDLTSGIGVNAFGYCDDEWQQAVIKQISTVQHTSNLFFTEPCAKLAQLLCEKTGMKKVFFGNSGAESNECSIKVARKYSAEKKGADCYTIVTLVNSFHGRTLTTLSATGQDHYHELFRPLTPGFAHIHANKIEELYELAKTTKIAGVLIECIQGEGGVLPLEADFVKGIEKFCKENDVPFMVDEVQTGNGRTGKYFSYMNFGVQPDIVSTAKGLAGGLPIGACLLGEKVQNVLGAGDHGSTFGGNPVSCAAALSILPRIDDALMAEVAEKGEFVKSLFEGAEGIESVCGMGLMLGIKPANKSAKEVVSACLAKGVMALTAKDKIRLLPPLSITKEQLEKAVKVILEECK